MLYTHINFLKTSVYMNSKIIAPKSCLLTPFFHKLFKVALCNFAIYAGNIFTPNKCYIIKHFIGMIWSNIFLNYYSVYYYISATFMVQLQGKSEFIPGMQCRHLCMLYSEFLNPIWIEAQLQKQWRKYIFV